MKPVLANAERPFFIIGNPRSGTTLLRLLLTCHPSLVVPPECGFIAWLYPKFGCWDAKDFGDPIRVSRFVEEVSQSRKFETWALSAATICQTIIDTPPNTYGEACSRIYRLFCKASGKAAAAWGDKNNHYLNCISELHSIFPLARFIHIVRDGRDVACSYRNAMSSNSTSPYRPSLPVEINEIAEQWASNIRTIRRHLSRVDNAAVMHLRYEDLTSNPEGQLRDICEWMNLPYSSEMLQFHTTNSVRHLEPQETLDWKSRTLSPVDTSTVGRYLTALTATEIAKFNEIAENELRFHAYLTPTA